MYLNRLKKILFTVFCTVLALTAICAFASAATKTRAENAAYTFVMKDGAEIRPDKVAIRFTSSMNKAELDALIEEGKNVKIGTVITPTRYLESKNVNNAEGFTKEKLDEAEVNYVSVSFSQNEGNLTALTDESGENYLFRACLYNVQEHNISKAFSARSYIEIDGEIVQYTDYTEAANSRSVYYVAQAAKESGNTEEAVAALCANFTVTVNSDYVGTKTITVKRGERLNEYADSENVRALTVENLAYLKGYTIGEEPYDGNTCITEDVTLNARYSAVRFGTDGENAYVSGCDDDYKDHSDTIAIPSVYAGKSVTFVRNGAFAENYNIKRVILPESVIRLDGCVFQNCRNLEYVSMTGITDMAFKNLGTNGIYAGESEAVITNNNFLNCGKLTVLVVNKKFNLYADSTGAQQFKKTDGKLSACINIYVDGSEAESQVNCAPSGANDLLTGNVYYKGDLSFCGQWKFDENGSFVTSEHMEHNFVNGKCEYCGEYDTQGVKYEYDAENGCYYVGDNKTLNAEEITILSAYNDGTHGELPVTFVRNGAFAENYNIKRVILPESVIRLDGCVFQNCRNLEYVSMTGITDMAFKNLGTNGIYAGESEAVITNNNFLNCGKLTVLVVNKKFNLYADSTGAQQFKKTDGKLSACINIYVDGSEAESQVNCAPSGANDLLTGNVYYKGDLSFCGQWKFDENGNFVTSEHMEHNFVNGKCEYCGEYDTQGVKYEYDAENGCYYVGDNKTLNAEEITILSAYNDGTHGELPVTFVRNGAFAENYNIKRVILPESVIRLDGCVFQNCRNLEYVSMTGITDMAFKNLGTNGIYAGESEAVITNNNFLNCGKLTVLVVNKKFNLYADSTGAQQFKKTDGKLSACINIYVDGSEAESQVNCAPNDANDLLTGNVYYYSEESAENCWHYEGGVPVLW